MHKWLVYGLGIFIITKVVFSYPGFDQTIPNGDNIRHPCMPGKPWLGLGHKLYTGGGDRNPFGEDFASAGYKWTQELCKADSDGDGRTNGEELGDPNCTWKEKTSPERAIGLSHPGVCEPVDSLRCKSQKSWVSCASNEFKCDAKNKVDVKQLDIRFPLTKISRQENTYLCMIVKLPSDKDYHIVAHQPILNNTFVTHHMVLSGCDDDAKIIQSPYSCLTQNSKCRDKLAVWSTGSKGSCPPTETGIRFGKSSYKYAQLQIHWANHDRRSDWLDSSGFRLFYSSKLRKHDMGILETGQLLLEIPPGKEKVFAKGVCPNDCSREMLPHPINVTEVFPYAQYLAKRIIIEQYRKTKKVRDIGTMHKFDYRYPLSSTYKPAVRLLPGDELRTTCEFDSRKLKGMRIYGEGTYDDSCSAYIYYYPKVKEGTQQLCLSFDRYSQCALRNGSIDYFSHNFGSCNLTNFRQQKHLVSNVFKHCGKTLSECSSSCKHHTALLYEHPCMKGYIRWTTLKVVVNETVSNAFQIPQIKLLCDTTSSSASWKITLHTFLLIPVLMSAIIMV